MYQAVTRGISVTVTPRYMPEESSPDQGRYFFAYTVEIINGSLDRVQLRSRYWRITDEHGHVQEVRGAGVVGEEPVLGPGESFSYTSGCPLGVYAREKSVAWERKRSMFGATSRVAPSAWSRSGRKASMPMSTTSGCPLPTPSGTMQGTYLMETAGGETFDAEIPAFSLDIPRTKRVLH